MIIQIKDSDIEYLKTLVRCFNEFTTYVHEGVHITVDPYASAEVHEAAESLTKFRDQCIFPEFFEMLNYIREQIDGDPVPDVMGLGTVLDRAINDWFYMWQEQFGITDGAEPLDSDIHTLKEDLVKECERVLEWQKQFVKSDDVPLDSDIHTLKEDLVKDYDLGFALAQHLYQRYLDNKIKHDDLVCPAHVSDEFENGFSDCLSQESQMVTENVFTSDEIIFIKCRIKDWFDYADGWLKDHASERPGSEDFNPSDIAQANKDRDICKSILGKLDNALSVTEKFLGSRESCEDKDSWDDFNKAMED